MEGKATQQQIRLGLQTATTIKSIFRSKMLRSWQIVLINVCDRSGIQRMIDQDGEYPDGGGREAWLRLAEVVGLSRKSDFRKNWFCRAYGRL